MPPVTSTAPPASSTFADVSAAAGSEVAASENATPPSSRTDATFATREACHGTSSASFAGCPSTRTSRISVNVASVRPRFGAPRSPSPRARALGFGGGLSNIPGTSVTNTARFGRNQAQSSRTTTSPDKTAQSVSASKHTSPWSTGTRPASSVCVAAAFARGEVSESRVFPPPRVDHAPYGDTPTAGTPASTSAETTSELRRRTASRVLAIPSLSLRVTSFSGARSWSAPAPPRATPYALACWWPKLPAPWTTMTFGDFPSASRSSSMATAMVSATDRNAGSFRDSTALSLCVMAAPPSFTTSSTSRRGGGGEPATCIRPNESSHMACRGRRVLRARHGNDTDTSGALGNWITSLDNQRRAISVCARGSSARA